MENLDYARLQMAFTLGFHIIFACIGMVMPFFMVVSHHKWLKTRNPVYLKLTKAWLKGVAIFFVTGAVSGTALSFELGMLWPEFMKHAGPIIGMPFSLEGAAFFVEAIALGFYLYGWNKLPEKFHWFTGVIIGVSGVLSGILVVAANGWMNAPSGFDYVNGQFTNVDPIQALLNPAWFSQALHMTLAAFVATSFGVAGIHAFQILRGKAVAVHKSAFKIAISFGAIAALLQPISGDISAKDVAERQPVKLAAMEAHFETEKGAPLFIGGIVDEEKKEVNYKIEIPKALSFLAFGDFDAEVKGLNEFPEEEIPPVAIVHYAFQVMVGIGTLLALAGILFFISLKKKSWMDSKKYWWFFMLLAPLGFLALEAGWVVTEVGRQPWIIYQIMRTSDAVTPMPGIKFSFFMYVGVYILLALTVTWLMQRQIKALNTQKD
ncbi:MAG: cytochrome ubiquinol oxidase subunit I [Zunongwangia sp.]|uniref:Cytochrome bd ubiquinol oxidase subunit I n=2 Tax=Zunongwangia profunda TaxID=398743 RepID=D5BA12_ZUNPS|nr:cytochrome ubiquinol oxidase subunit I [Zunongwangia profunda]MAO38349.1 cytochrome ubiquinol oxidase subunit I [Zunongwangia sp.]ADF52310.1 cytochrome bd ubiquinol oxidase subunit I [Zunongwangia profunda SM-A87]MAS71066.1 cytochrome ubiquinol oxidase subunit I [Zunongwangia sp.]HAJ80898.1 cytochrome ubiquinol oxidase subunit I [Zunongwangia profunda]HCV82673.1 cytochrome ubiquinol oxidase subunit I [Zunongwangia profunda]|tara:strand:- start:1339 stop:2640 length:1302 start_codon:yes stop_codon:yes gene_type:complete